MLARDQTQPFTTESIIERFNADEVLDPRDVENALGGSPALTRRGGQWFSLVKPTRFLPTALQAVKRSHLALTPDEAIERAQELVREVGPRTIEATQMLLEESGLVARHDDRTVFVLREHLPELRVDAPTSRWATIRLLHRRGVFKDTHEAVAAALSAEFANKYIRRMHVRETNDGPVVFDSAPVSLGNETRLVAWTPTIDRERANSLREIGWWMWRAGDREALIDLSHIVDKRTLRDEPYRGIVSAATPHELAHFLTKSFAAAVHRRAAEFEIVVERHPVPPIPPLPAALRNYPGASRLLQPVQGFCAMCNRPLRTGESARRGIGPVCETKMLAALGDRQLVERLLDALSPSTQDLLPETPAWTDPLSVDSWHSLMFDPRV
ncbi:hypothetical protein IGS67_12360 [Flavimobilis sp. GY10621]|uniref:Winged helix DNA-binding domain-containing protein n=1 Tax=Flavimobilis rhizosphaerae TaxID=2775421 RepID=A0ABR9DVC3_9MICO|nr:DUF6011 domain-containing protein [Flavimobilis rhizosphaerae]MBD9700272.1 hypothetical protein [Flavimobilis rhizosphaerae]